MRKKFKIGKFLRFGILRRFLIILIMVLLAEFSVFKAQAQFISNSKVSVAPDAILSVYTDYINTEKGEFKNDGQVYFFKNWKNNGEVGFTPSNRGITHFIGSENQMLSGTKQASFQHVVFENTSSFAPFQLSTIFEIAGVAYFKKGVINAEDYGGEIIFADKASHSIISNDSYVNGSVLKTGISGFEFPIGSQNYYRPAYDDDSGYDGDRYNISYFCKSTDIVYPHIKKESQIKFIDNAEYWVVNKEDRGSDHIVLSLTLHPDTTPSYIYKDVPRTKIGIVRWDTGASRWISEGGNLDSSGRLIMTQLSGDGIVTLARIVADE